VALTNAWVQAGDLAKMNDVVATERMRVRNAVMSDLFLNDDVFLALQIRVKL
jgi:hypothetical protein